MRLERLIIENFRIFRGNYDFNFQGKDLIILNGTNGNGKSSVFDAIQWCLTGDIQRYKGSSEHQDFNYLINEQEFCAPPVSMKVEVWLVNKVDNTINKIRRSIRKTRSTSNIKVTINDQEYGVRDGAERIRQLLIKSDEKNEEELVNESKLDFSSLFSASHLLSQDELRSFVQNTNPRKRFQVLENLLGFKKYGVHFREYLNEVNDVIQKEVITQKEGLENKVKNQIEITTRLKTQTEHMLNIDEITEPILTKKVNELYLSIFLYFPDLQPIDTLNQNSKVYLIETRNLVNIKKNHLIKSITLLQDCLSIFNISKNDLDLRSRELSKELSHLLINQDRRIKGIDKAQKRVIMLNTIEKRRKIYQATCNQFQDLQSEMEKIEFEKNQLLTNNLVKKLYDEFDTPKLFQKEYLKMKNNLNNLVNLEKYRELEFSIKDYENQKKTIWLKKIKLEEQSNIIRDEIKKINNFLFEIEKKRKNSENDHINQIIHEVQSHLLSEDSNLDCLVCGSTFNDTVSLHASIQKQLQIGEKERTELEQKYIEQTTKLSFFNNELSHTHSEIELINKGFDKINLHSEKTSIEEEKYKIKLEEKWFFLLADEIKKQKNESENFLENNKIIYALLQPLETLDERQDLLKGKVALLSRELVNLLDLSGRWAKYLEKDSHQLQQKIQGINNYLLNANQDILLVKQNKQQIEQELLQLKDTLKKREEKKGIIQSIIPDFNGEFNKVGKGIKSFQDQIDSLGDWEHNSSIILQEINSFLSKGELLKLREDEKKVYHDIKVIESNMKNTQRLIDDINKIKSNHDDTQSNLMTSYLSNYSEVIDHLFRQISPHAIYQHVHLVPRQGKLYIIMSDKSLEFEELYQLSDKNLEARFNASLMFSSGQASVLAVCIFLALNQNQNWTDLNLLGIDDPFQNMDDINVFSFIDVLSQVGLEKQILISTHSKEFSSLLHTKMQLTNDKIGYINFHSYSLEKVFFESNCSVQNENIN